MLARAASKRTGVGAILRLSDFERLAGELKGWRVSDDLKIIERAKGSAVVLPFVKGLHLSAQLIYVLRAELNDMDLEVDWGHLLDAQEESCSPECDIIIHRKGHIRKWNGNEHPVMDFRFVRDSDAVAVVSCKSYAKDVDDDYAKKLRAYVRDVFLFAECCAPNRVNSLRRKARTAGYAGFWHLYTYDKSIGKFENDPSSWQGFLDAVRAKVRKAVTRK